MSWDYLVIIVFLGAVVPLLGRRRIRRLLENPQTTSGERVRLYGSTIAMQWLLLTLILWRAQVHGMTRVDLGLALPRPLLAATVSAGLAAVILCNQFVALRFAAQIRDRAGDVTRKLATRIFPQSSVERGIFFLVVVTVSICEELIYRGFLQYLFASLLGSAILGILLSAALFSIAHLYQGRRGVLTTSVVGILFGAVRAWTLTQLPGMIAHFLADVVAGFLLPVRIREIERAKTEHAPENA